MMIADDEPPAFEIVNPTGAAPVLLLCDHASRRIPRALGDLGLGDEDLARHIAWDIGAGDVTRRLAARLGAPAVLCSYSRLVIDCNRHLHDPGIIVEASDGTPVPGNHALGEGDRDARIEGIWRPYHQAIAQQLHGRDAVTVLSIHSCTPQLRHGPARPWHIGICWETDRRLATPVLAALRRRTDLVVGDNEPYALDGREDYTIPVHAMARGLRHLQVEFRQDLIATLEGAARHADILFEALAPEL